jgi:hypothetical protein
MRLERNGQSEDVVMLQEKFILRGQPEAYTAYLA